MSFASVGPRFATAHREGTDYANSRFRYTFSSATLPTPRAWVQVTAALPFEAAGFHMWTSGGNNGLTATEVAIGAAGSEVIVVEQFAHASQADGDYNFRDVFIPVRIPAGARVAFRILTGGSVNLGHQFSFYPVSPWSPVGGSRLEVVNAAAVDYLNGLRGTQFDPGGAAHTMGAWTEIVAATARPYRALSVRFSVPNGAVFSGTLQKIFEFGVGPAGSEVGLFNEGLGCLQLQFRSVLPQIPVIPVYIPQGSRISMRLQTNDITRDISPSVVALYGLVP